MRRTVVTACVGLGALGAGVAATFTIGAVHADGPLLNLMALVFGAASVAGGVHILQKPAGISVVDNAGTDAFGMQQWGSPRTTTSEEGMRNGAILLTVGLVLLVFGVVAGAF